MILIGLRQ